MIVKKCHKGTTVTDGRESPAANHRGTCDLVADFACRTTCIVVEVE